MKGKKSVALLVILMVVMVAFQAWGGTPVPGAAFTMSPAAPTTGQSVTFTDTSTQTPTTWAWTFGDGGTSTVKNPTHVYASAGTFSVTLKATNAGGSGSVTKTVTVKVAPPVAGFSFSPTAPTSGQTVTFTDSSTNTPTTWAWTFGDGGTSTVKNPTHVYASAGTFSVTLKAGNTGGSGNMTKTVTVKVAPPVAGFSFSPTVPTSGQTVTFTDASTDTPTTWAWTFGDGGTSTIKNPTHVYAAAGTFSVTLKATNAGGSTSVTKTVTVTVPAPVAGFSFSPTTPASGQTVTFTDTSTNTPATWAWTFGDGGTSTIKNPTHVYAAAGTFSVTLKATNAGGSGSVTKTLTVSIASPVADYSFSPSTPSVAQVVTFTDTSTGSPTTWYWSFGDGGTSTIKNPTHTYTTTGGYTVQLVAGNAAGTSTTSKTLTVSPAFTLSQTISDGAQRTTLAFSGLGMMTGNLEAQSFFPPGKVADYTGFQYLRDNDPDNMGHNTSFLTRIANNVIYILNDTQFAQLKSLAIAQQDQINLYGYQRFPLMKAFRRLLDGDIPTGSTGLNLNAVKQASRALYLIDGQISYDRAVLYAAILNSLDTTQKAYLAAMKGKGWTSWPDVTKAQIDSKMKTLPPGAAVAVMTYAGDLFSWYAGSVDADVYFCPERQGTYYGSFYIKDAPAIGHEGYSIDEQLTATAGRALSDSSAGYVTPSQAALMSSLVDTQRDNLYGSATAGIVKMRTDIATLLRSLLTMTGSTDAIKTQVLDLSGRYGDLDGENNYYYATVFAQVYATLTTDQKTQLAALRKSIMSGAYADGTAFDFSVGTTPFLYSTPITDQSVLTPYTSDTDWLFFEPK